MNVMKDIFPVTLAGFGLNGFSQYDMADGAAYHVTLTYNNKPFCLLYNDGNGGATCVRRISDSFDVIHKKVLDLLERINAVACKQMGIKKTFLYSLYVENSYEPEVTYLEGLFELLYELNEVYATRKEKSKDTYVFAICGDGNMLVDSTGSYSKTGGYGTLNTQTELQNMVKYYKGVVMYNYIIKVKANTRVLHLTLSDLEDSIVFAKQMNTHVERLLAK